ncbi:hypothetical protein V2G26_006868 [Clonostachys chloroleuca]
MELCKTLHSRSRADLLSVKDTQLNVTFLDSPKQQHSSNKHSLPAIEPSVTGAWEPVTYASDVMCLFANGFEYGAQF